MVTVVISPLLWWNATFAVNLYCGCLVLGSFRTNIHSLSGYQFHYLRLKRKFMKTILKLFLKWMLRMNQKVQLQTFHYVPNQRRIQVTTVNPSSARLWMTQKAFCQSAAERQKHEIFLCNICSVKSVAIHESLDFHLMLQSRIWIELILIVS